MENFSDLTGKTILVTGGSRGIGEAIVRGLVRQGAHVILNYATGRERALKIQKEAGADKCLVVGADIGDLTQLKRLWEESLAWRGRIDTLVNNAAIRQPIDLDAPIEDWDAHWEQAFRVNLMSVAHLSRLAILHFRQTGGGSIIGLTARIAVRGDRTNFFHDGAMKGGMNSLLRGIARFHAKEGVETYLLCVGVVETEQATDMVKIYGSDEMLREIPLGRFGTPAEVADAVILCAGGHLKYATGCTIDLVGASFLH
jgi:NAD(P)-dependent dehydrogenase (short-subunit alcohol dehydrogenase family)